MEENGENKENYRGRSEKKLGHNLFYKGGKRGRRRRKGKK